MKSAVKEEMKPWQKGFDMSLLKEYERLYEAYNSYSDSPFSQIKKNTIADALDKGTFHYEGPMMVGAKRVAWIRTVCKKKTDITLYDGIVIGTKLPGDIVTTGIATDASNINTLGPPIWIPTIFDYDKHNWVVSWADDRNLNQFLTDRRFRKIGSKITTFAEVQYIWFRDSNQKSLFGEETQRIFPVLPKYETVSVKRVAAFSVATNMAVSKIAEKMKDTDSLFQNHYSNYNKGKSWSAFSLRGYTSDPTFMTKPIEMNDKWKEEHKDEVFKMQDTTLIVDFPEVYQLLRHTFGSPTEYHRIRLMKLKSGDGELTRHTDQVDPEQGLAIGKLARFHFPIITNPDVKFTVWDIENKPNTVNMKAGECWVLDVRKPHAAKNGGKDDRIHLVVDVVVNSDIIKMLEAK
jgi:hypothetical protein